MSSGESSRAALRIRVPAGRESLPIMRTLMTAVGSHKGLDLDAVVDLRLAVDEACTAVIRVAEAGSSLVVALSAGEKRDVRVRVWAPCMREDLLLRGSFSWHVLSSLADEVATFRDGADVEDSSGVCGITMTVARHRQLRHRSLGFDA